MTNAAIHIKDLSHAYDETPALNDVSFDVAAREIFGVLGPNGGGKTTLFRILSTLMAPGSGSVAVCAYNVADAPHAVRRSIGVVFQAPSLDVTLSVIENLRHQGHLYGLHGSDLSARIADVTGRLGIADRAKDRVDELSGGMKRRVEIAKGLLHTPAVLLLDEPSTGLDPGARQELWRYLVELRDAERMTIVLTTHYMDEAARCDRLALLDKGKLVALGAPGELTARIGGDIVTMETRTPQELRAKIAAQFGGEPFVLDGSVRIEREGGHEFIGDVVNAFPEDITAVRLGKPSLEDVFIHTTGHRFWDEAADPPGEADA